MTVFKAVLIDLSGTLHIGDAAIPGAVEALAKLLKSGLIVRYVTNTTKESKSFLYNRLISLGFDVEKKLIHSSLSAVHTIIKERNLRPMMLISPEAMEDFADVKMESGDKADTVIIGLAPNEFHYEKLNTAFRALINGAKLIAIHAGKYYQKGDSLALGPGCFVKGLEYSAQVTAELVGKPNMSFFQSAIPAKYNILASETVMIGDDVTDDILGALKAGMKGVLVQTGKYRNGDERKIKPDKPTKVVESFSEAVDWIIECNLYSMLVQ